MSLPFTIDQFFEVFAAYNAAIWPAQVVVYPLAIVALVLALRPTRTGARTISVILAGLWIWMGAAYHLAFFSAINPAAYGFGVFFILQGLLFIVAGTIRGKISFEFRANAAPIVGAVLIAYATAIYPLLGMLFGRGYPAVPLFGVAPCPTTLFTFGMLLWARSMPRYLPIIPTLWAVIGTTAAVRLDVPADYGLGIAAAIGVFMIMRGTGTRRRHASPAT